MNQPLMAAMAALDAMDDLFSPLTEEQKIEAMEHMVDELESRIRCESVVVKGLSVEEGRKP